MTTLKVDSQKRIRLGDAKPGQVFARTDASDGSIVLTPVKAERKERFPKGSLLKYFTPEKDAEEAAIFSGCAKGPK
jgi:hypothetical protein